MKKCKVRATPGQMDAVMKMITYWLSEEEPEKKKNLVWISLHAALTEVQFNLAKKLLIQQNSYMLSFSVSQSAAMVYALKDFQTSHLSWYLHSSTHFVTELHKQL